MQMMYNVHIDLKTYQANLNTISNNARHKCGKCFSFIKSYESYIPCNIL